MNNHANNHTDNHILAFQNLASRSVVARRRKASPAGHPTQTDAALHLCGLLAYRGGWARGLTYNRARAALGGVGGASLAPRILTRRAGSIADWDFLGAEVLALARVRGEVLVPATLSFSGVGGLCICMCVDFRTGCGIAELPRCCRPALPCRSKRGHSKVGGQDRAQAGESAGRARPCAMEVDVEAAGCSRFL